MRAGALNPKIQIVMTMATQTDNETQIKQAFEQPQWYLQRTRYNIRIRTETVAEFVNGSKCESILDIGCGDGSLSLPLLNTENHLTLLDQSQAMLCIARSRTPAALLGHVDCVSEDFMKARLSHRTFDLILCIGVLAYVERRRDFIARIKALLKPGGSVIIECTDANHFLSYWVRTYQALRRLMKPVQMRTVIGSSSEVSAMFRDLGFRRCGSYRYSMPPPPLVRLMSQKFSYQAIRAVFGSASYNHNAWLGRECIYHFTT